MKIVVMGGSGFIGSKLVPRLRQRGDEAVAASPHLWCQFCYRRDWPKF